jgi:xylulokinase
MMDQNKLLLGLDISTTGAKALLIDPAGNVVASASNPLTLSTPRPLWSEQNPSDRARTCWRLV